LREDSEQYEARPRRLLLACGNSLRSDDGVGLQIAETVEADPRFAGIEVISAMQFTPELAELVAAADVVAFVDASTELAAGEVRLVPVSPAEEVPGGMTHHMPPAALLMLAQSLYGRTPAKAAALAMGAVSFDLGEGLSEPVRAAIPRALSVLRDFLRRDADCLDRCTE
jgi:hydrogenase maturation protease